ncbi:MAG: hypothetical protein L0Y79_10950 [Chlorobi bacterium]|nr:hypothetical protein [Chlorobiota bacterium]MCI0715809.1 hypothetical protein [Chlorobiota bacterium]
MFLLKNEDVGSLLFITYAKIREQNLINLLKEKLVNLEVAKIFIDHYKTINENVKDIYDMLDGAYSQLVISKMVRKFYNRRINAKIITRAES